MKIGLSTIKKHKRSHCKGVTGSYAKMRSACKRYVEKEVRNAKKGSKTATRLKATKKAMSIVKSSCKSR